MKTSHGVHKFARPYLWDGKFNITQPRLHTFRFEAIALIAPLG